MSTNSTFSSSQEKVNSKLPIKQSGIWNKIKKFFTKEINVTMTPSQKKVVDYLSSDLVITMTPKQEEVINKMKDFLFQDVTFGKKNKNNSKE